MVAVHVYVEGGGDTVAQRKPFRVALGQWIEQAVPESRGRVRVTPCGGRTHAYERFCEAIDDVDENAFFILLVDSEEAVTSKTRWEHVRKRTGDGWTAPPGATEDNLHFMAQVIETWLCADPEGLASYFGDGFKPDKLPRRAKLEDEPKLDVYAKIEAATKPSKRGRYGKGAHPDALTAVRPDAVVSRCPHARVFVDAIRERAT